MISIKGHCVIRDQFDNIILNRENDIHPGNFARVIARSLSDESNYWVNSVAFGNGATVKKPDGTFKRYSPNDGISPDYSGWKSTLYHETFRKQVDPTSLGSNNTIETTVDGNPSSATPVYTETHRNIDGVVSYIDNDNTKVTVSCTLGVSEPSETKVYTFDEIALYTGQNYSPISGYQDINLDVTKLVSTTYLANTSLQITLQIGETLAVVTFIVDNTSFSNLIEKFNRSLKRYKCYAELLTNKIRIHSKYSSINVVTAVSNFINTLPAYVSLGVATQTPNESYDNLLAQAVDKNNPNNPELEAPRLLTHLIFDPIDKPQHSIYYITYTLTVVVEPTPAKNSHDFVLPDDYRLTNTFEYNSVIPSTTWNIYHQLGYTPKILVFVDTVVLVEDVDYKVTYGEAGTVNAANNQITIRFKTPQMGTARLY